jgi:cellulose synthase/poly-beta-1,6-N-acetylglucosamine synthase-like glycosyltransferase
MTLNLITEIFSYLIILYAVLITASYVVFSIISLFELKHYTRKNSFIDYRSILTSPLSPSVSLVAPAYNEGTTIVESVRSLLSIHYQDFEIIIVNDGSKDDTLEKLIDVYSLEKVNFALNTRIESKPVRGVYKSSNAAYSRLVVVDKENGGAKADAVNAGINVASKDLVCVTDADCIISQDAFMIMVKPFLEAKGEKVIACGGSIRVANSCEVANGKVINARVPSRFIPRVQVLEYLRAFLVGRMTFSRINGLLLVSGGFGFFDRKILLECGGFNHKAIGEDMELVVRLRKYMTEQKRKFRVVSIPDPVCWTEVPSSAKILYRQRNRWARGGTEVLWLYKKMFMNPQYGVAGLFSYPYWLLFEFLAPFIEFFGIIFIIIEIALGSFNFLPAVLLLGFCYTFAIFFSSIAILSEEITYKQYTKKRDILKLIVTSALEPLIYHPFVVWSAVKGNYDLLRRKETGWGEMTRTGFAQAPAAKKNTAAAA